MVKTGVIGCGYWGPNLIRNFRSTKNCEMVICCDKDEKKLERMKSLFPGIKTTTNYQDLLDAKLDAVAIATPVGTHYPLAKACLMADKHVLVEKPITRSSEECQDLINTAESRQRVLMVGHTFEYTAAVNKIKAIIDSGEIGEIMYVSSTRVNLGLFQPDINVIWDLAPHDVSIITYVLGKNPISVNAQGKAHYTKGIEDVAMTTLYYENGMIAFLHNSWLDPQKIRNMVFVGTKKMLVYDDISANEKIKIYDKGVEKPRYYDTFGDFHYAYRYGDIYIPKIDEHEALGEECRHFLHCIVENQIPRSNGYVGLNVIKVLEAANQSLTMQGTSVAIDSNSYHETMTGKDHEASEHRK